MNNQQTNSLPIPALPIDLQVRVEPYNAAMIALFVFLAVMLALMAFGFVFKR